MLRYLPQKREGVVAVTCETNVSRGLEVKTRKVQVVPKIDLRAAPELKL